MTYLSNILLNDKVFPSKFSIAVSAPLLLLIFTWFIIRIIAGQTFRISSVRFYEGILTEAAMPWPDTALVISSNSVK